MRRELRLDQRLVASTVALLLALVAVLVLLP